MQPYNYITSLPGKNVRKKLAHAFNIWLNLDEKVCAQIAEMVTLLHNSTLLIDDIEDSSQLRRGVPTAHKIFGVPFTLNTANYVYFIVLEKCLSLNHPDSMKIYTEQLLELHRGQGMDLYWRDYSVCPTMDEYELMVKRKTGGLFGFAIRLMQIMSKTEKAKTENFRTLTDSLGLYFQIRDDFMNLTSEEYAKDKTYCEDFTEGKFSFPVVHAIKSEPDDGRILSILKKRTEDIEMKKYAVSILKSLGSLDFTLKRMQQLDMECRKEIQRLGGNRLLVELLDSLKTW